jgi:hypothetical protein
VVGYEAAWTSAGKPIPSGRDLDRFGFERRDGQWPFAEQHATSLATAAA